MSGNNVIYFLIWQYLIAISTMMDCDIHVWNQPNFLGFQVSSKRMRDKSISPIAFGNGAMLKLQSKDSPSGASVTGGGSRSSRKLSLKTMLDVKG